MFGFLLVLVINLLSSLFSPSTSTSLVGNGLTISTFIFSLVAFLALYLSIVLFRNKQNIFYFYLVFLSSFVLVAIFQTFRLFFGPKFLSLGLFISPLSNLIGKWNDLGIYIGLGALLLLVSLELLALDKKFRVFLSLALLLSLVLLFFVNFTTLWIVLALFSLLFLIYVLVFEKKNVSKPGVAESSLVAEEIVLTEKTSARFPFFAGAVLIISLACIFGAGTISTYLSKHFNISPFDVRPSLQSTIEIAKGVLKEGTESALLGSGPNLFREKWLLYKPQEVNQTPLWNSEYDSGIGTIASTLITGGLLTFFAWMFLLGALLYVGWKAIFSPSQESLSRYLILSSFLASIFLWTFECIYDGGPVVFVLAYVFTGVFLSLLYQENRSPSHTFSFSKNSRNEFLGNVILVVLLIASLSLGYLLVKKALAAADFQSGVDEYNKTGNLDVTEAKILKAYDLSQDDLYLRNLVQIEIVRMNGILSDTKTSPEILKTKFQDALAAALGYAKSAVLFNKSDYQNWVSLGNLYETLSLIKMNGAYENGRAAYEEALKRNPKNPVMYFLLARLDAENGNLNGALQNVKMSLQLKSDFTEGLKLQEQIQSQIPKPEVLKTPVKKTGK